MSYVKLNELAKKFGDFYVGEICLVTGQDSDEETDLRISLDGDDEPASTRLFKNSSDEALDKILETFISTFDKQSKE
jgi:hypothetical protein